MQKKNIVKWQRPTYMSLYEETTTWSFASLPEMTNKLIHREVPFVLCKGIQTAKEHAVKSQRLKSQRCSDIDHAFET